MLGEASTVREGRATEAGDVLEQGGNSWSGDEGAVGREGGQDWYEGGVGVGWAGGMGKLVLVRCGGSGRER